MLENERSIERSIIDKKQNNISEIKEKIKNYKGPLNALTNLKVALKRSIEYYTNQYINMPDLSHAQINQIIQAREECCNLEIELRFHRDAAHGMHFISSCYHKLGRDKDTLRKSYYWVCRALEIDPENKHHLKWCETVAVDYSSELRADLERVLSDKHIKDEIKDEVKIKTYREIIDIYQKEEWNIQRYRLAFELYGIYCKQIPYPEDKNYDPLATKSVSEIFESILGMVYCLSHIISCASELKNNQKTDSVIDKKKRFIIFHLIRLQFAIDKHYSARTLEDLITYESAFLQIIALHRALKNTASVAICLSSIANQYYLCATANSSFKTNDFLQKMSTYARQAMVTDINGLPKHLRITEIFELYAHFCEKFDPGAAEKIYHEALKYSAEFCEDSRAIFFCLKGVAACHLKLAKDLGELPQINFEICSDAARHYAAVLKYTDDALSYLSNHLENKNVSTDDCLHMLFTANYELGLNLEYVTNNFGVKVDPGLVESYYKNALDVAVKGNNVRHQAKAQSQLANFYYKQEKMKDAKDFWKLAVQNHLTDLKNRAQNSEEYQKLNERSMLLQQTYFNSYTEVRFAYTELLRRIIDFGHNLKNSESTSSNKRHRFFSSQFTNAIARSKAQDPVQIDELREKRPKYL